MASILVNVALEILASAEMLIVTLPLVPSYVPLSVASLLLSMTTVPVPVVTFCVPEPTVNVWSPSASS